jgi:two-component system, NtrC family, sensor kinase
MLITLKTKIWLTVLSIVLMFAFFTLFYFPAQQGKLLLKNYNNEVQNLANTVALGVKIAIKEQNFEGVQTAMEFVKDDPRLQFVSMLQTDTLWDDNHTNFKLQLSVFKTFPEKEHPKTTAVSSDSIIVKQAPYVTSVMSGSIMLAFTTREIIESKRKIRLTSLIVSGIVFLIGIAIGFWLARNISVPVLALRDAAKRIGEGDLSQRVNSDSHDEIGELGKAFNTMIDHLSEARKELHETNVSLSSANHILNNTLGELKSTQAQLIHSEKMASLGELTAGIAHEIQNPLNFVNNFSEVNAELIDDMHQEIRKGNYTEAEAISKEIKENEKKIIHHGKRADAIVKGMLQHSRSSTSKKEPSDINALADEYLRLCYHGLRAKDKTFNTTIQTDFDTSIGKINIIPQNIGRVLLNLFTNAFYAVTEKKKLNPEGYEPTVSISTKKINDIIEIRVKDNGNGIPEHIMDKIFQPFFTTKPTGQGTGLGLSLSYDIIKAHGGELKVITKEEEFAEFIIQLPLNVS